MHQTARPHPQFRYRGAPGGEVCPISAIHGLVEPIVHSRHYSCDAVISYIRSGRTPRSVEPDCASRGPLFGWVSRYFASSTAQPCFGNAITRRVTVICLLQYHPALSRNHGTESRDHGAMPLALLKLSEGSGGGWLITRLSRKNQLLSSAGEGLGPAAACERARRLGVANAVFSLYVQCPYAGDIFSVTQRWPHAFAD
jgi:hypothetical protein